MDGLVAELSIAAALVLGPKLKPAIWYGKATPLGTPPSALKMSTRLPPLPPKTRPSLRKMLPLASSTPTPEGTWRVTPIPEPVMGENGSSGWEVTVAAGAGAAEKTRAARERAAAAGAECRKWPRPATWRWVDPAVDAFAWRLT